MGSVHQLTVDQIGFSLRSTCGEMHGSAFLKQGKVGSLTVCMKMHVCKTAHWLSLPLWDFNLSYIVEDVSKGLCIDIYYSGKTETKNGQ